jgi:hypothetical protein
VFCLYSIPQNVYSQENPNTITFDNKSGEPAPSKISDKEVTKKGSLLNEEFTIKTGGSFVNAFPEQIREIQDSVRLQNNIIKVKGILEHKDNTPISDTQIFIAKVTEEDGVRVVIENGKMRIPGLIGVGSTDLKGNFNIDIARQDIKGKKIRCTIMVDVGGIPIRYSQVLNVFFEINELNKEIDLGKIIAKLKYTSVLSLTDLYI